VSFGTGTLRIAARLAGTRTVLERVRYDGISRCSRAFAHGDAALVVLSQLGPGVVRGDRVSTHGRVGAGAHLIVTAQTATRLMGGAADAAATATWCVEAGAVLELIGQPLVASANARYSATISIDMAPGALAIISDVAAVPSTAHVRLRTLIRREEREAFYDAIDAGAAAPHAVGTLVLIGVDMPRAAADALDAAADAWPQIRTGVGILPSGVFVRALATDTWALRCFLEALHDVLRRLFVAPPPPSVPTGDALA
jgi:urease accessory protein